MAQKKGAYTVQAVRKAFEVLDFLSECRADATLRTLASQFDMTQTKRSGFLLLFVKAGCPHHLAGSWCSRHNDRAFGRESQRGPSGCSGVRCGRLRQPASCRTVTVLAQVQHRRCHLRSGSWYDRLDRPGYGIPQHDLSETGCQRRREGNCSHGKETGCSACGDCTVCSPKR